MITYAGGSGRGGRVGEGWGIETTDFVSPEEVFGGFFGTGGGDVGGPAYDA